MSRLHKVEEGMPILSGRSAAAYGEEIPPGLKGGEIFVDSLLTGNTYPGSCHDKIR